MCASTSILDTGLNVLCQDLCVTRMNCVSSASWCCVEIQFWYPKVCEKWCWIWVMKETREWWKRGVDFGQKCGGQAWIEMWRGCAEVVMVVRSRDSIHHPNQCRGRSCLRAVAGCGNRPNGTYAWWGESVGGCWLLQSFLWCGSQEVNY